MTPATNTPFASFNARQLSASEVGETFVAPAQFVELCRAEHTLLLGPRGSGKTTLLKMLTAPALRAWSASPYAENVRPEFRSIYVPADVLWASQLEELPSDQEPATVGRVLSEAAVATNVLYSFVQALEHSTAEKPEPSVPSPIATELARAWGLTEAYPSYYGLRLALRARLTMVRTLTNEAHLNARQNPQARVELPSFVFQDFLDTLSLGIEVVNEHENDGSAKWALSFDELEISPTWLQHRLLGALRSTDQRLLYKLSASPLQNPGAALHGPVAAQEGQDYRVVRLWYSGSAESKEFCRRLAVSRLSQAWGESVDPRRALGVSGFTADGTRENSYDADAPFWDELRRGAAHDSSLRQLLKEWKIDPNSPGKVASDRRDQLLRKIKPILLLRNEFRVAGTERQRRKVRTRKRSQLYSGAEALYAISDGNPRWLIGLLADMLVRTKRRGRISRRIQSDVIWQSSQRFRALLGALPKSSVQIGEKPLALVAILDSVGKYFSDRMIRGPFPLDPVGSFVVDSHIDDAVIRLIELAVGQGALVYVDSEWRPSPRSPRGKRFRLSFMLAPHYKLPLRLYDPVSLRECLHGAAPGRRRTAIGKVRQADLFPSGEG